MRTTVSIDDQLLERAKQRARQRGVPLRQLLEESLRVALASQRESATGPAVPVFRGGTGLAPGVTASTRGLLEALDEGSPVERAR